MLTMIVNGSAYSDTGADPMCGGQYGAAAPPPLSHRRPFLFLQNFFRED